MNVNMANKNRMFALKPININDVPKEVRENIERQFKNTDEESASLELSGVGKKLSIETSRKERPVLETKPVEVRHVLTIMPRTGYAAIDNSLMDSLKNVSDNVKQSAYSIIRQDILRGYSGGMSETERQDRISFGLAEAQYLADNFMGDDDASRFMTAMRKIAGIAVKGTTEANGQMTYDMPGNSGYFVDKDGYTVENTDTIGMMKKYDAEKYAQWKELQDKFGETGDDEYLKASMRVTIQFVLDNASKHPERVKEFEKEKDGKIEKLLEQDVKKTFEKIDTKSFDAFMSSLKAIQNMNMNLQNNWFNTRYNDMFKFLQNLK